jgi:uncharacterized protein YdaU (DUF1376 family)
MEEAVDWCWARSKEEIEAVEFVLKKFFDLVDGVYMQQQSTASSMVGNRSRS